MTCATGSACVDVMAAPRVDAIEYETDMADAGRTAPGGRTP